MSRWQDQWRMVSRQTPRRLWNHVQVQTSYYWSKWTGKPFHWGLPTAISIEPTTACNLGCPECPSGLRQFTRRTGSLKQDFFRKVIDELAPTLSYLTFYFQGEPYINPHFLKMVKYASDKGIYTATSTNGHFLNSAKAKETVESGLDRLIISVDGTTQETYSAYRINGSLDKVIQGTKNILHWKKELKSATPHVIFQFLVVRPNEHQIPEIQRLADDIGVDELKLKTAQIYDYHQGSDLIPKQEKYSRYQKLQNGTYSIKNEMTNHCWKMWNSCVITWDGLVVPCCFDKDATHQLGDLKKQNFKTMWQSPAYQNFRAAVLKSRSEIEICRNCTEGTKVWA
ncbi:MAG: SPASM domain-containing protein [Salibacteraceae bacterium]